MLSATQTPPSLRWRAYVCTYITMKNPLLFADSYTININSDTRNRVIINNLAAPASATLRSPIIIGLLFCYGGRVHLLFWAVDKGKKIG